MHQEIPQTRLDVGSSSRTLGFPKTHKHDRQDQIPLNSFLKFARILNVILSLFLGLYSHLMLSNTSHNVYRHLLLIMLIHVR